MSKVINCSASVLLFVMLAALNLPIHASNEGFVKAVAAAQQSGTCSGVVKDNTGEVIVGASVRVKNSSLGAITDIDGRFTLPNVSKGVVVVVTYLGYKPYEFVYDGSRTQVNIVLKNDDKTLNEVVITAYGMPKQAKQVGYATTKVSTEEIERINAVNPVNAL